MNNWLEHEPLLRLIPFLGIFLAMALWEIRCPKRAPSETKAFRWFNNLAMVVTNTLLLRVLFPGAAFGVALIVETQGWGLFHWQPLAQWPNELAFTLGILLLDMAIWGQHLTFHSVPMLWRLHRVHHTDLDFDLTTGLRFHPLEILISMLYKASLVLMLGISPEAVLAFEILLSASALFNHGNVHLPVKLDNWLRRILVTPDMHRVHHSWYPEETHSNFGFSLSCWDRLFGTYRAQPRDGHLAMTLGLPAFRKTPDQRVDRLLLQPLKNESGANS